MDDSNRTIHNLLGVFNSWIPRRPERPAYVSRDYWMPDQSCRVCYECDSQFTFFNRRHHCRFCGRIFCSKCTSHWLPAPSGSKLGQERDPVRVCDYCYKQWRLEPAPTLATVGNGVHVADLDHSDSTSVSTNSFVSVKSSSETSDSSSSAFLSLPQSGGLRSLYQTSVMDAAAAETQSGCNDLTADVGEHMWSENQLSLFQNRTEYDGEECRVSQFSSSMSPPSEVYGYFDHVHYDELENEYKSRKVNPDGDAVNLEHTNTSLLGAFPPTDDQQVVHKDYDCDVCEAPSSLYVAEGVDSTVSMDFESNMLLWLPPEPVEEDDRGLFMEDDHDGIANHGGKWGYFPKSSSFGSVSYKSRDKLNKEHKRATKNVLDSHFRALVSQLLQMENIPLGVENGCESWLEIIMALSWEAATLLKPDMSTSGQMDPGGYVKVKCLASGRRSESMVVKGVVCKKNVVHRRMRSNFEKARLLILGGALEYQRVSSALSSIDTLLQQEMHHLKMAVAKIEVHRPDVLLVQKSVSRYAQEYLLEKGISLVLNVKRPLLERIARCTDAQIVPSIDHLSSPKLGSCDMLHVEKFLEEHVSAGQNGKKPVKTLMFFEGCPKPLGCTILLRGANADELKKVKRVVQYGVFAAYHLALETSFLADEGASLPVLPLESPITVALLDKSSNIDRSISSIPGFTLPEHVKTLGGPQRSNTVSAASDLVQTTAGNEDEMSSKLPSQDMVASFPSNGNIGQSEFSFSLEAGGSKAAQSLVAEEVSHIVNDVMDFHVKNMHSDSLDTDANKSIVSDLISVQPKEKQIQIPEEQHKFKEELPAPSEYQSIFVSPSSRCVWNGSVCKRAQPFRIHYYGNFDKPLGRFLRDDLLDQNYRCRSCNLPAEAHIQCYTHRQGTLTISVKRMQEKNSLPGEKDGKVWMWQRCLKCPRADGMPPATRRVVMSDAAWGLSFGKFLELSFSNHAAATRLASCGHSLHRDCLRFYGFGKMVACFRYASIDVHSIHLPPSKLDFNFESEEWTGNELNKLVARCDLLFSEVHNALRLMVERKCHVSNLEALLQKDKSYFQDSIHRLRKKEGGSYDILEINRLWRELVFLAYIWDHRLVNGDCETKTKQMGDILVASSDGFQKPEKSFDVPVLIKSIQKSDSSCPNAVDAKPDQFRRHGVDPKVLKDILLSNKQAPDCLPSPPLDSVSNPLHVLDSVTAQVTEKSFLMEVDSTIWLGMSFTNFYQSLNENFWGGAQKLDTLWDYNPVYISCFLEAELQGRARLLLPVGMYDTVVPVYDDEPTSIIAYALLSPEYNVQVSDKTEKTKDSTDTVLSLQSLHCGSFRVFHSFDEALLAPKSFGSGDEAAMPQLSSSASRPSSLPAHRAALPNLHPRVSFTDDGPLGKVKYTVTCYYAKQFESLRKMCCPSDIDFVRSLSRCKKWGAEGGKSNVFFAKTLDDRFIIKQVTKTELDSFLKFGTRYFQYLTESISSPTCLAKILGIYQVASKHVKGGKVSKMDMLVMENLLFRRNVTRLYDLKGSVRSRYNPDSSGSNKVLLDQNLLEAMPTSPIFVGNQAKRLLERAVWNDTAFLASIDVMDYSLLVGVDEEKHELVLGIIDFMRQYTWDKHLETCVKASGILGGPKKAPPTVISPKQYKIRFRKAMRTYFLTVPDQWSPAAIMPGKSQTDVQEEAANKAQTSMSVEE